MKHAIIGLLAETFIHPGAEQTGGIVDLPVAREKATNYPFIAGSSLKGALLDAAKQKNKQNGAGDDNLDLDCIFGKADRAGNLLVSDARLLLLPVRSLTSSWRWATCPHLLERLSRDLRRSGSNEMIDKPPCVANGSCLATDGKDGGKLYLEERNFTLANPAANLEKWVEIISQLFNDADAQNWLEERLIVLHDDDFAWFATNGLAVQARNVLDEKTKESKNLWYEETLPPDTLMYALLAERTADAGSLKPIQNIFRNRPYLQVGGNETVGQGWFNVQWEQKEETND